MCRGGGLTEGGGNLCHPGSSRLAFHYGDGFTSKYVPAGGFVGTWFFSQMIAAIQQIFVGYITFTMKWNKANNPDKIKSEKKKAKFIKKLNKGIPVSARAPAPPTSFTLLTGALSLTCTRMGSRNGK